MNKKVAKLLNGFTLVELLVVIAVLGILISGAVFLMNPGEQIKKGRDLQRKRDFDQIKKGLEIYYSDNDKYPVAISNKIEGKNWGESWLPYMVKLPKDPLSPTQNYLYESDGRYYRLYAKIERCPDSQAIQGIDCATANYNYSVASSDAAIIDLGAPTPTLAPLSSQLPPPPSLLSMSLLRA